MKKQGRVSLGNPRRTKDLEVGTDEILTDQMRMISRPELLLGDGTSGICRDTPAVTEEAQPDLFERLFTFGRPDIEEMAATFVCVRKEPVGLVARIHHAHHHPHRKCNFTRGTNDALGHETTNDRPRESPAHHLVASNAATGTLMTNPREAHVLPAKQPPETLVHERDRDVVQGVVEPKDFCRRKVAQIRHHEPLMPAQQRVRHVELLLNFNVPKRRAVRDVRRSISHIGTPLRVRIGECSSLRTSRYNCTKK